MSGFDILDEVAKFVYDEFDLSPALQPSTFLGGLLSHGGVALHYFSDIESTSNYS